MAQRFDLYEGSRKKVGQSKKSQKGYISPIWGEAPAEPISTKVCMVCDVHDVITYAKFHIEILMGYDFTGGRISHFPIDFCMGLTTVQRKGAACDIIIINVISTSQDHSMLQWQLSMTWERFDC